MQNCSGLQPTWTLGNAQRSRLCRGCWTRMLLGSERGETMNRAWNLAFRLLVAIAFVCSGVSRLQAQAQAPAPAQGAGQGPTQAAADKDKDKAKDDEEDGNPFAPEPAPALPPGMTGSDASDPRANLTPGMYNAGETAMGLKHLTLVKKPEAFQLGATDPDDPKVQKTISQLGIGGMASKLPKEVRLPIAQLGFANSDLAFQGNHLFLGNFYGVNIYDISDPANVKLLT